MHADGRSPRQFSLAVRLLIALAGSVALALGIIGIFVPVLPTTPFLLLAAACYLRSSRRLYAWLLNHRLFGRTIRNYLRHKSVDRRTKILALFLLWLSLTVSAILVPSTLVRILLPLVGIGVSIHLFSLKTMPKGNRRNTDSDKPEKTKIDH
ncbi:MAG: YbaN family protein [Bacillota bacterium]|nr:YbaN family protein [Bacillota bacterium]